MAALQFFFFGWEFERGASGAPQTSLFFILIMELLSKMIDWSVEEGFLMGFIVKGSNGKALTPCPLFFAIIKTKQIAFVFADDAVLFVG